MSPPSFHPGAREFQMGAGRGHGFPEGNFCSKNPTAAIRGRQAMRGPGCKWQPKYVEVTTRWVITETMPPLHAFSGRISGSTSEKVMR